MKQVCKHNPKKDIREVAPNLSIDLAKTLDNKMVPATGTELSYNNIQNPSDIVGRIRDTFDAIDAQRSAIKQGRADAAKAKVDAQAHTSQTSSTAESGVAN